MPIRFGGPREKDNEVLSAEIPVAAETAGIGERGESPFTVIRSSQTAICKSAETLTDGALSRGGVLRRFLARCLPPVAVPSRKKN